MKCQMTVHEIQKGDTLYKLAKQYKTTVPLILLANPGVNPYNLRVGDKLNICEGKRFEEKQGLDELQIVSDFNKVVYQYLGFLQLYMASFSGTEERTELSGAAVCAFSLLRQRGIDCTSRPQRRFLSPPDHSDH